MTDDRILIVRLSAIGDVIHGVPVLCALRAAFPEAFLGWVVEGRAGDLLEGHASLDALIRVRRGWWKSPREVWALRKRLRDLQFDTVIDLQCLTKSALAGWLSGARRRIGKAGADGRELSKWFHNELVAAGGQHVIDHYLELLTPLGVHAPAVAFDLPERAVDVQRVESWLREAGLTPGAFAIVNPGAGWPSKIWPAARYGEVARHLARQHALPTVVVWAGDTERDLAATIVAHSAVEDASRLPTSTAAQLAPPTSIPELAALARRACLFVGSDTGPMHLAVAVETPAISLHGPSRAAWCGAYGPRNRRLQVRYEDGTARERRGADDSAMRAISVEMVCEACDAILAERAAAGGA